MMLLSFVSQIFIVLYWNLCDNIHVPPILSLYLVGQKVKHSYFG